MKNMMDRVFSEVAGAFGVAAKETANTEACDACLPGLLRERLAIIAREIGADTGDQFANIYVFKAPGIEIHIDQQRLWASTGRKR